MPPSAQHVDAVYGAIFEENFFRETINLFRRDLPGIFKRNIDSLHCGHLKAIIFEELGEFAVELFLKISDTHELLYP